MNIDKINVWTIERGCPHCGEEIRFDMHLANPTVKCECGKSYHLDVDAECIDGRWHDCSRLIEDAK